MQSRNRVPLKFLPLFGAALAAVIFLTACGGSDDDNDSSADSGGDTPATATSAPADAAGGTDVTPDTSSDDGGDDSSGDTTISPETCPEIAQMVAGAQSAAIAGLGGSTSDIEYTPEFFAEMASRAPEEIRGDMQVIATAFSEYLNALADAGVDLSDPASLANLSQSDLAQLQSATESLDTEAVNDASDNIQAFIDRECS